MRGADQKAALTAGELLSYREGATGTVTVRKLIGTMSLAIDGKVEVRPISVTVFWALGGVFALILVVGVFRSLRRPGRPKPDLDLAQENPLA